MRMVKVACQTGRIAFLSADAILSIVVEGDDEVVITALGPEPDERDVFRIEGGAKVAESIALALDIEVLT